MAGVSEQEGATNAYWRREELRGPSTRRLLKTSAAVVVVASGGVEVGDGLPLSSRRLCTYHPEGEALFERGADKLAPSVAFELASPPARGKESLKSRNPLEASIFMIVFQKKN